MVLVALILAQTLILLIALPLFTNIKKGNNVFYYLGIIAHIIAIVSIIIM
jgi:hypothetical protein